MILSVPTVPRLFGGELVLTHDNGPVQALRFRSWRNLEQVYKSLMEDFDLEEAESL